MILLQGMEQSERLDILISLTNISSQDIKSALNYHLCKGFSESNSCEFAGINKSNFTRALNKLNEVAVKVELIKEIDYKLVIT